MGDPDGDFTQPRVPYHVSGVEPAPFTTAPRLGEHQRTVDWSIREVAEPGTGGAPGRPLAGIRIVDLTAFWAGPSATQVLAALGAEVIKVEGPGRPDGMRFSSTRRPTEDRWWEASPVFHAVNAGKRAITLDLDNEQGRALLDELLDHADGLIENFSPRVLDGFGITWDRVHRRNPHVVMMRMPNDIDLLLARTVQSRNLTALVAALLDAGIPAAPVLSATSLLDHTQLRSRDFYETIHNPVVGTHTFAGLPFRLSSRADPWFDRPAPTLGQHNAEILGGLPGRHADDLEQLATNSVIGTGLPA